MVEPTGVPARMETRIPSTAQFTDSMAEQTVTDRKFWKRRMADSAGKITKAMELVASSKMRRAKERVEHSRPYFETLHETLTKIAAADPRARNPYLRRDEVKRTLLIVIAGDRGLAGGYNSNVLKQAGAEEGEVLVLPIGKRSAEYFVHHEVPLFTQEVLLAADVSVGECFQLSRQITEGYLKGEYDAVKICYTRFDSMMTQTAATMEVLPLSIEPTEQQKADARRSQILYKPSSEEVFSAIIPEYVGRHRCEASIIRPVEINI